mgnify:CR=1 FL=1
MSDVMNIKEFARITGFSPATISRAFSNRSRVNGKTAEEILRLAERYNYRPNRASAASFGNRTQSVGVMIHSLNIDYFAAIFRGIQSEMMKHSYLAIYQEVLSDASNLKTLRMLIDHRVDGMIMIDLPRDLNRNEKFEISRMNLPVVVVDRPLGFPEEIDSVETDDETGGRLLADHLLSLGHRRFSLYWVPSNPGRRMTAFRDAVERCGALCELWDWKSVSDDDLIRRFRRADAPTAVFPHNDLLAAHLYRLIRAAGRRIPQEISVVGYADLALAELLDPPLTTIRENGFEVGRAAAEILLKRIYGSTEPPVHRRLPVEIKIRSSAAPVPDETERR